jgi:hypothetical protein
LVCATRAAIRDANSSAGRIEATSTTIRKCPHPLRRFGSYGPATPVPNELPVSTPASTSNMNEIA